MTPLHELRWFRASLWVSILVLAAIRFLLPIHYDEIKAESNPDRVPPNGWWAKTYPGKSVPRGEAGKVGYSLYRNGDWANPFISLPTGPTAHVAPLFPLMVAGLYRAFGDGPRGAYSIQVAEALVLTAEVMMLPLVARALGGDMMIGFIAAIMSIFGLRREWVWEANYVGFLLVVATQLACSYVRSIDIRVNTHGTHAPNLWKTRLNSPAVWATALGSIWGTILLTSPSTALVWAGWIVLGGGYSYHRRTRIAWLPALVIPLVMIAPWTWRNYRVLHGPVLLRSNLGLELMVANNACAEFSLSRSFACFWHLHPNTNRDEARRVIDLGEINYNRWKLRQAAAWIRSNPRTFWRLTCQRALFFWFPTETGKFADVFPHSHWAVVIYPATLLSLPGLLILWRISRYGAVICLSFLVLYPPIYYIVLLEYRYRFPIMWVTFLLAAVTIWRILPQPLRSLNGNPA